MTVPTNIQVINNPQGLPAFAVLPWDDYIALTKSKGIDLEKGVPSTVVDLAFDNNYSALKAWRTHLGLTQEEVATRLGISQAAYSQHENSDNLRKSTREKVAEALGLHPEQLNF